MRIVKVKAKANFSLPDYNREPPDNEDPCPECDEYKCDCKEKEEEDGDYYWNEQPYFVKHYLKRD